MSSSTFDEAKNNIMRCVTKNVIAPRGYQNIMCQITLRNLNYCRTDYGSYEGVIKREAVYKCTNKDYLPEA